jgi:hypothetical protein
MIRSGVFLIAACSPSPRSSVIIVVQPCNSASCLNKWLFNAFVPAMRTCLPMDGLGVFEVNLARNSSSEFLGHPKGCICRCSQYDVSAIWCGTITPSRNNFFQIERSCRVNRISPRRIIPPLSLRRKSEVGSSSICGGVNATTNLARMSGDLPCRATSRNLVASSWPSSSPMVWLKVHGKVCLFDINTVCPKSFGATTTSIVIPHYPACFTHPACAESSSVYVNGRCDHEVANQHEVACGAPRWPTHCIGAVPAPFSRDSNRVFRSTSGSAVRFSPSRWSRSDRKNTSDPSPVSVAF